jgi:hypothetical protein
MGTLSNIVADDNKLKVEEKVERIRRIKSWGLRVATVRCLNSVQSANRHRSWSLRDGNMVVVLVYTKNGGAQFPVAYKTQESCQRQTTVQDVYICANLWSDSRVV